jgi:hypothetical protein
MKQFLVIFLIVLPLLSCNNKQLIDQAEPVVETAVEPERSNDPKEIIKEWNDFKQEFISTSWKNNREQNLKDVPSNLKEAMEKLEKELSPIDLEIFKNTDVKGIVIHHNGLESYDASVNISHMELVRELRNRWDLRQNSKLKNYFNSRGVFDPESMSAIIINSFAKYLQGKNWRLEVEEKYPEHFEIVDLIINNDNEALRTKLNDIVKMPDFGELPPTTHTAINTCNGDAFLELRRFYPDVKINSFYPECDECFFSSIVKKDTELLKDRDFIIASSFSSNFFTKNCNNIPSFDDKTNKALLRLTFKYGNDSDFKCLNGKYGIIPDFAVNDFEMENYSEYKIKILLENIDGELFSDRAEILRILASIHDKDPNLMIAFIKATNINISELEKYYTLSSLMKYLRNSDVLEYLFEIGMSVSFSEKSATIFEIAVNSCNPVAIDFLLEKGADPNQRNNKNSQLSLSYLIENNCFDYSDKKYNEMIIMYLITKGLIVKNSRDEGAFPLSEIIEKASFKFLKFISKYGYDTTYKFNTNESGDILYGSLKNKDNGIFKWLISENGFNVNNSDKDGDTPLHHSVRSLDMVNIKQLIKEGASPNIKNKEGKSPLDMAKEIGAQQFIEIFEKK